MERSIMAGSPTGTSYEGLAPLLAFVAGYVDATTFLAFGGLFVAQATGSLVVAGSAFEAGGADILKLAAIPAFILAGIVTTAVVRSFGPDREHALAAALFMETVLVAGLALSALLIPHDALLPGLFGLGAMGVQSALVRLMLSGGSTNVMTTNLTQLSIDIEGALAGLARNHIDRTALASLRRVALLILGFLAGVLVGSVGFHIAGSAGVVLMVAVLAALALCAWIHALP
jgi:uncharacterized membrane protein YoaK (UPF0700 family)